MDTRIQEKKELYEKAKHGVHATERFVAQRALNSIMTEGKEVNKHREHLIMAIRNKDHRAESHFRHELEVLKAERTKGRQY